MPTLVDLLASSSASDDENSECRSSAASEASTDTEDLNEGFLKDSDLTQTFVENYSIPRTSDLLSWQNLKDAVSKNQEKDNSSNLLVLKQSLLRYFENRLTRGETVVQKEKFCDVLCNNGLPYEQAERFISFFDCENIGEVNISLTLEALRTNFYFSSVDDVTSVIKIFVHNNILPGFFDVHCDEQASLLESNRRRILSRLRRTRLSSTILPYVADVCYSSVASARSAVARQWMKNAQLKKFDKDVSFEKTNDFNAPASAESVGDRKILTSNRVYKKLETSSKKSDVGLMINDDSATYWQSDGTANSHWIRASMQKDVHIWQIFLGVAASDSSYMPQFVVISVGNYLSHMREIKEIFIPPDFTGDFLLLGRQNKYYRYVQINIRRCVSDGCDTRVRNLRLEGYRSKVTKEKILNETCSSWYLNVLTSTVEACLPMAPSLRTSIMQISLDCVEKLTPFMLAHESTSSAFVTPRILKDVERFIKIVVFDKQCDDEELKSNGVYILINLALASGNLDSILNSFRLLLSTNSPKLNVTSAVKLGVSLKKLLHSIVRGISRRLTLNVIESDGDPNAQWKDLTENNSSTKIFRSVVGKRDLHVVFQTSTDSSSTSTLIGSVRVRVPTDRQNAARRITVYAVRDKMTLKQFFERKNESIDNVLKSKIKIIGRCTFVKGNECEIQTDPCLTPYVIVKFSKDDRVTSTLGCVEINSVSFSGVHVVDVCGKSSAGAEFDGILNDFSSSMTFTNVNVASTMLNVINLLLKLQQPNVVADVNFSSFVDVSKGFIFDFKNFRLKTLYDCFTTIFNESHDDDETLNDVRLNFLHMMHLIFNKFSKLIVVERTDTIDKIDESSVTPSSPIDVSSCLFDSLTHLIADETTESTKKISNVVQNIIVDGTVIFFPNNDERRTKLLSLLKSHGGDVSSIVLTSLCNYFAGKCFVSLLNLPTSDDDLEWFQPWAAIETMQLLYDEVYRSFVKSLKTPSILGDVRPLSDLLCAQEFYISSWHYQNFALNRSETSMERLALVKISEFILFSLLKLSLEYLLKCIEMTIDDDDDNGERRRSAVESFIERKCLRNFLILFLTVVEDEAKTYDVDFILKDILELFERLFVILNEKTCKIFLSSVVDEFSSNGRHLSTTSSSTDEDDSTLSTLRTWASVESPHPYETHCHMQKVFRQNGATEFEINFDQNCALNEDHYLSFIDHNGVERRFKGDVETSHWPKRIIVRSLNHLRFVFHAYGGAGSKWGYKFHVIAKSSTTKQRSDFDTLSDTYVLLSKVAGKVSSLSLSTNENDEKTRSFVSSAIWKAVFSNGPSTVTVTNGDLNVIKDVLVSMINAEERAEIISIRSKFIDQYKKNKLWLGISIERTCFATFAVLIWHIKNLKNEFFKLLNDSNEPFLCSDRIQKAFQSATVVARMYLERRQIQSSCNSSDDDVNEKMLNSFYDRARSLLEYQPIDDDDDDVEKTCKILSDFLLNDSLSIEETENLCCEILFRRVLRLSALNFASNFLKSSSTSFFLIRDSFLSEIFKFEWVPKDDDADEYFSSDNDEFMDSYCNFMEQLLLCYEKSSADVVDDSKSSLICVQYLFVSLSIVDVPLKILHKISSDLIRILLKFVSGKNLSSMKRKIRLSDDDSVDNGNHYELFVNLLKKCRNDDDYCNVLNSSRFYTYKLFVGQYGDVLPIRPSSSCVGCGVSFGGVRYQCTVCADTMLCLKCFKAGIGPWEHFFSSHLMMRFDHKCDQCGGYIAGTRHHCAICDDYDLCDGCFKWALVADDAGVFGDADSKQKKSNKNNVHQASHEMLTINAERFRQTFNGVQILNEYLSNYSWLLLNYVVRRLGAENLSPSNDNRKFFKSNVLKPILNELIAYIHSISDDAVDGGDDNDSSDDVYEYDSVETKFFGLLSICGDFCSSTDDVWWFEECLIVVLTLLKSGELEKSSVDHLLLCLYGRLLSKIEPIVADHAMNATSATPVDHLPDGFLTVSFLFTFGATFLMNRDLMWSGTVAKIIHKLYRSSSQWATIIKDFVRNKLMSDTIDDGDSKIFCFLLTTGFPNSLYPGVDVFVTDGGRIVEGVVVDSSSSYADDNDDDDFIYVLDTKTRYQCKIKSKYIDFVDVCLPLKDILTVSELIDRCQKSFRLEVTTESNSNDVWIPSAFYLKSLCQFFEGSSSTNDDAGEILTTLDMDFIRLLVTVASKSTDLPITVTTRAFDIVVGHIFSKGLPSLVRRMLDLTPHVFKEGIKDPIMTCMGQLIADFDVDWFVLLSIYDLKRGGLDPADLLDEVKQIYLNDRDSSSFSRSVFYRAAILAQNCSSDKLLLEDLSSTVGSIDVGLRTLDSQSSFLPDSHLDDDENLLVDSRYAAIKEWFGGICESRLLRDDGNVSDRHENLNNHLLAAILIRRLTNADGKDVETKKFRQVFQTVCEKLTILFARKFLSIILSSVSNEARLFSLVRSIEDEPKDELLAKILCLVSLLYITEDVKPTASLVLKNTYELFPPNPEYVKILCNLGCKFLREGVSEKFVHYLDAECKKINIHMHHSSSFTIRFFGAVGGSFSGQVNVEYGRETKTIRCGNENDKILPKKLFLPSNQCTVEWETIEKRVDCESAWVRLDCDGVETPGRFHVGYDLLELILDDKQIHNDIPWTDVWSSIVFVASSSPAKYRIKMLKLMTKILNVFNEDAYKYRGFNLDFSKLLRFWTILQTSDYDGEASTTSKIMSEFLRSSTLLFYTAENLILQLNSTNDYAEKTSSVKSASSLLPCLKVYAQGVGVVAALSEAIGVENKSTQIIKRFYNKKHSSDDDAGYSLTEFLSQMSPTLTTIRPPLDNSSLSNYL